MKLIAELRYTVFQYFSVCFTTIKTTMNRKKSTHPVMLRLPEDIYDWLQSKADKERRTINAQAAMLFEILKSREAETDKVPSATQEQRP